MPLYNPPVISRGLYGAPVNAGGLFSPGGATVQAPNAAFSASLDVQLSMSFTDTSTGGVATSWNWDFGDGTTSTSQNPSKVYTTEGTKVVSLTASNAGGSSIYATNVTVVNVDGPGNYFDPLSAAGWSAIGWVPPTMQWDFQEPSGTVIFPTFVSGGIAPVLLNITSITPSFSQTRTGWRKTFVVQTTEVSTGRISNNTSSLNTAASSSVAAFAIISPASASATRVFMMVGSDQDATAVATNGRFQSKHNNVATTDTNTGVVTGLNAPRPVVWFRNCTTGLAGTTTDVTHVSGTMAYNAMTGHKGLGNVGGVAGTYAVSKYCIFTGSAAEQDFKQMLRSLGWAVTY